MSYLDGRCPDCGVVDGCICGPDDGPLVIPCLRPAGECRDAIAALTSELAEARNRLATIVDETVGIQPALPAEELLTLLEKWAHETRIDRDEARRQLGEVCERGIMLEQAVSDLRRERDAYRDAKRLGPWMHNGERPWGAPGGTIEEWLRIGPAFVSVNYVRRADGTSEAWGQCPGMSASFRDGDEARAAIDAALISGSWWLEGGPHKAGEAK